MDDLINGYAKSAPAKQDKIVEELVSLINKNNDNLDALIKLPDTLLVARVCKLLMHGELQGRVAEFIKQRRVDLLLSACDPPARIHNKFVAIQNLLPKPEIKLSRAVTLPECISMISNSSHEMKLPELSELLEVGFVIVDKTSNNNVMYQIETLVDPSMAIFARKGVSNPVIERSRTIYNQGKPTVVTSTDITTIGKYDTYYWIEKYGELYRISDKLSATRVDSILHPSVEVDAFNCVLEKEILKHQGKSVALNLDESRQIKADVKAMRVKIVKSMVDVAYPIVEGISTFSQLGSTVRKPDFLQKLSDAIIRQVLVDVDLSDPELQLTLLYEASNITSSLRNIFQSEFRDRKSKFKESYKFTDKGVVVDRVVSLLEAVFTSCVKFLLPNKKSISQALAAKELILSKLKEV